MAFGVAMHEGGAGGAVVVIVLERIHLASRRCAVWAVRQPDRPEGTEL